MAPDIETELVEEAVVVNCGDVQILELVFAAGEGDSEQLTVERIGVVGVRKIEPSIHRSRVGDTVRVLGFHWFEYRFFAVAVQGEFTLPMV